MRLSVLFVLGLAACSDYAIEGNDKITEGVDDNGDPDIAVNPTALDFGELSVDGTASVTLPVTVTNEGDEPLEIFGLELENPAAPYTISAISSVLIQPGGTAEFTVTYAPQTAEDSNTRVLVASNDPDEAEVPVDLLGTGVAPVIQVTPESYDFGSLYIGCEVAAPITIKNVGNQDLVVSDFTYVTASDDLDLDLDEGVNGQLPWTLEPGDEAVVYVDYGPLDDYADEGFLTVDSNDPFRPQAQAYQNGGGSLFGENLDMFEQPIKGMTDIIFTLDWSCSMSDDIARVQSNFDIFIATLTGMDADYHVAVVTDDDGCVNGSQPYIDNTMDAADQEALFDTMVNNYNYGMYTEMGFTLIEAATASSNTGAGDCNEDMLREDATLAVVGVTDEVEQSANPWSYYVSTFQDLKADPDDVVIHAIAGDYPSGCGGNEPGVGWYEATVATGGLFLSICATDWASHLEALAEGSAADLSSFELTQWPVPETIVVRIDGVTVTTGWTYNSTDNTVDFDENSVPEGGAVIEVEYALYGDCTM